MRKRRCQKGFTLIEMLACVVTLILIGLICTTGMNLASISLKETTFESDSQMLESTINMYLSDILRHATDVEVDANQTVVCFTNDTYYIDKGKLRADDGYLVFSTKLSLDETKGAMIVNESAYAGTLSIRDFVLKYDSEKGVFSGSYRITSSEIERTKLCEFSYRTIGEGL